MAEKRTPPTLLTVSQFVEKHPWPSEGGLRWLRFNEATNGFDDAFLKVGGRLLIDEDRFFEIVQTQNHRVDA